MTLSATLEQRYRFATWYVMLPMGLLILIGCGPAYEADVSGMVTLDGQLLESGTVVFHPADGGPAAYGHIRSDGSYVMQIGQGDGDDPAAGGIRPGDYRVTVVARRPPADGIGADGGPPDPGLLITPEKYASAESSGITVQVQSGKQVIPVHLLSPPPGPVDKSMSAPLAGALDVSSSIEADGDEAPPTEPAEGSTDGAAPVAPQPVDGAGGDRHGHGAAP